MKKFVFTSMLMLPMLTLTLMTACNRDDDDNNYNDAADYSSNEIVELLTGKWEVSGEVHIAEPIGGKSQTTYSGFIEFNAKQKFNVSETILFEDGNQKIRLSDIMHNYHPYTILRKNGKNYIQIYTQGSLGTADFLIKSINKTSFELILDDNIDTNVLHLGHIYMTMISPK